MHASARTRWVKSSVAIVRKGGITTARRVAKKPLRANLEVNVCAATQVFFVASVRIGKMYEAFAFERSFCMYIF